VPEAQLDIPGGLNSEGEAFFNDHIPMNNDQAAMINEQ
jgi:hypothetical protein